MNERIQDDANNAIVSEIAHGPFSNPYMRAILNQFGKKAFGRSSACMEFERFLKQIGASGKSCLEIGTFHGITAILLSQFFERVYAVSVDEEPGKLLKHDLVRFLNIKNVTFFDVRNNNEKRELIQGLEFDFAYVDGDHTHDTDEDFALVRHCGRALFHEYWPLQPPVWNLVNSLPASEVTIASVDCFAYWQRAQ